MKREIDFYYFLSFITFYIILFLWYGGYINNYEGTLSSSSPEHSFGEHGYVSFVFKVILGFPFGLINWLNNDPLNIVYYFIGALFYSYVFYKFYYKTLSKLLWVMLLLNVMAAIFLLAFFAENPLIIPTE
jgi:hypothetical protein